MDITLPARSAAGSSDVIKSVASIVRYSGNQVSPVAYYDDLATAVITADAAMHRKKGWTACRGASLFGGFGDTTGRNLSAVRKVRRSLCRYFGA
jgi:hypothetical protein